MQVSPGVATFAVGLLLLALAGVLYQQSLIAGGAVGVGQPASVGGVEAVLYICPMHPQVEQDHEGTCPICGYTVGGQAPEACPLCGAAKGKFIEIG